MFECLTDIIGITTENCPCTTGNLPEGVRADLARSKSGLYLDDLAGGVHLRALKDMSACHNLAELALAAKDEAIRLTSDDIVLALSEKFAKNKRFFKGEIGQRTYNGSEPLTRRYAGIRIRPQGLSDGVVTLKNVALSLDAPVGEVTLKVVRSLFRGTVGEVVAEIPVAVPLPHVVIDLTLPIPLRLPLQKDGKAVEYYIVYDRTDGGGILPRKNKVSCNCGTAERALHAFVDADGVTFDDIAELNKAVPSGYAMGLSAEVDVRCDNQNFICREYDENDSVAITLAHATRYKAGELLIEAVLKSPEINRYTMMNREYLWGKRNHYRAEYNSRINFLTEVVDITATDCYICKGGGDFVFSGIMA